MISSIIGTIYYRNQEEHSSATASVNMIGGPDGASDFGAMSGGFGAGIPDTGSGSYGASSFGSGGGAGGGDFAGSAAGYSDYASSFTGGGSTAGGGSDPTTSGGDYAGAFAPGSGSPGASFAFGGSSGASETSATIDITEESTSTDG